MSESALQDFMRGGGLGLNPYELAAAENFLAPPFFHTFFTLKSNNQEEARKKL